MAGQNPVLPQQGHQVGHRAQGHEVEIIAQLEGERHRVVFRAQLLEQTMHELEHQADRAEVAPAGIRAGLVRLDVRIDQQALAQGLLLRAVMVDDDDLDALRAQVGDLIVGVGATIERDKQRRLAALQRTVDGAARQSVAILRPPRDDKPRGEPERPQHADQQRGAADTVHIIVAQDHHGLAAGNRRPQPRGRGIEAAQEKGIAQPGQRGRQKFCRGSGLAVAVAQEQLRQHRVDPGALAQGLDFGGRERRIDPAHEFRR